MAGLDEADYEDGSPRAGALIESLRSFGYTAETAIADLVDNAISAGANTVNIFFQWYESGPTVVIVDNGRGMNEAELHSAMLMGSKSPLDNRSETDLGRFGLGLKTASFSQARELTVFSRSTIKGTPNVRCWSLDLVESLNTWALLKRPSEVAREHSARILGRGTAVVWTQCDRLVGESADGSVKARTRFLATAERVKEHLGMTFHRFLERKGCLSLTLNDRAVVPWNPILKHKGVVSVDGELKLPYLGSTVSVRPYVLPFRANLTDNEATRGAGPRGWTAQQGFYVYRNDRLLVAGDWLGLGGKKDEHTKLARILIDFDAADDLAWQIDVKKSTARPPGPLQDELRRVATATRRRAEEVYRFRGEIGRNKALKLGISLIPAWVQKTGRDSELSYALNRDHPLIASALKEASAHERRRLNQVLRLAEELLPATQIALRLANEIEVDRIPFKSDQSSLDAFIEQSFEFFRNEGHTIPGAVDQIATTEPFIHFPELVEAFREKVTKK